MNINDLCYLIGGAPRVGKSQLSKLLAKKIGGHIVSTDSIRTAAKKMVIDLASPIFRINRHNDMTEQEWLDYFTSSPDAVVDDMNEESRAAWPAIRSFIRSFADDDMIHIVEGVHLLPELIHELGIDNDHILFIGNTSPQHVDNVTNYAKDNPDTDWMIAVGYSPEKIKAQAQFSINMSQYFKTESAKCGYRYIELGGTDYPKALTDLVSKI